MKGPYVLITGGAGFIGINLAARLASLGQNILIYDNLSRKGVKQNLNWILSRYPDQISYEIADILDKKSIEKAVMGSSIVYHLAAQVASQRSLMDPMLNFEINVRGTLNILEILRKSSPSTGLIFSSSNKVMKSLSESQLHEEAQRYSPLDEGILQNGISEHHGMSFYAPYGCSKGAAEQYVLDYSRSFGLQTTVLRISSTYGPHQQGTEDQGWIAHFMKKTISNEPITLYGNGKQVRDPLSIEDLVDALVLAREKLLSLSGQAYQVGGGPKNSLSLLEFVEMLRDLNGKEPNLSYRPWRSSDQKYYVSDNSKYESATDWSPKIDIKRGIPDLYRWLKDGIF